MGQERREREKSGRGRRRANKEGNEKRTGRINRFYRRCAANTFRLLRGRLYANESVKSFRDVTFFFFKRHCCRLELDRR